MTRPNSIILIRQGTLCPCIANHCTSGSLYSMQATRIIMFQDLRSGSTDSFGSIQTSALDVSCYNIFRASETADVTCLKVRYLDYWPCAWRRTNLMQCFKPTIAFRLLLSFVAARHIILTTRKPQLLDLAQSYGRTIEMPLWEPDWTILTKDFLAELTKIASHFTRDVDDFIFESAGNAEVKVRISSDLTILLAIGTIFTRILLIASSHLGLV